MPILSLKSMTPVLESESLNNECIPHRESRLAFMVSGRQLGGAAFVGVRICRIPIGFLSIT